MQGLLGQGEQMRFYSKCNEKLLGSLKQKRVIIPFMPLRDYSGWCVVKEYTGTRVEVRRVARRRLGLSMPALWQLSPGWWHWRWRDLRDVLEVKWRGPPHSQTSPLELRPHKSSCLLDISTWILNMHFKFCPNSDSWSVTHKPALPPTSLFQESSLSPLISVPTSNYE